MTIADTGKKAILILGMHRSGTSALTRVVNLLGASLGKDLMPAAPGNNPLGFWEHRGVVAIHDEMFQSLGRSWRDLRALPQGWLDSEPAQAARKQLVDVLTVEFGETALWSIKDPRLCRILPLWHQVLSDINVSAHAVFVLRHPNEVAASLLARDGIAHAYSRLSWLEHTAEAELGSRDISRSVISYDNLLLDWRSCMKRLSEDMKRQWPVSLKAASQEVGQFLNLGARHHKSENAERRLPAMVEQLYDAFSAKADDPATDWRAIEDATESYVKYADTFLDGIDAVAMNLSSALVQIDHKNVEISHLSSRLDSLFRSAEENNSRTYLHNGLTSNGLLNDVAKIYWRGADENYSEERAVCVNHDGMRQLTWLRFELPEGCAAAFIRFDPSEFSGEFLINAVHVGGASITDFDHGLSANGSHIVSSIAGELRIASVNADPNIELDIGKLGLAKEMVRAVELSCCRITPYGELRDLIESAFVTQRTEVANSIIAPLEQSFRANVDKLDALAGKLSALNTACNESFAQARDIEAKQVAALEKNALETRTNLETVQQRQHQVEFSLEAVTRQVKDLAKACDDNFDQLRSAEAQQTLDTADLKIRLDAILTHQQRTFMDRLRRKKIRGL